MRTSHCFNSLENQVQTPGKELSIEEKKVDVSENKIHKTNPVLFLWKRNSLDRQGKQ